MKITVFVKQVPDTSLIEIDEDGTLHREGVPSMLDPFSFFALKMAVRMRDSVGGTVTAATMGPQQAESALIRCLEYGADDAYLLCDNAFAGSDTWATARTLAEFVNKNPCDIVFCGMQAADGDTGQVPAELSILLGRELASYVTDFEFKDGALFVHQNYNERRRVIRLDRPSVISVSRGPIESEGLPSISDYLKARERPVNVVGRVDLGLGLYSVGSKGSHTKVTAVSTPMPVKRDHSVIDGTDASAAAEHIINEAIE